MGAMIKNLSDSDSDHQTIKYMVNRAMRGGHISSNCVLDIFRFIVTQMPSGQDILRIASYKGDVRLVSVLLKAGANPDQQDDKRGATPLLCASKEGHLDVVKLLLDHVIDPDLPEKNHGLTPLMAASHYGHTEIAQVLLRSGANKDRASKYLFTALHIACDDGHVGVVEVLLKAGVDTERITSTGYLPLTIAVEKGYVQIVKLLLEAGADRTKINIDSMPHVSVEIKGLFESVVPLCSSSSSWLVSRRSGWVGPALGPCHLSAEIRKKLVAELVDENDEKIQRMSRKYRKK